MYKSITFAVLLITASLIAQAQTGWTPVSSFGTNPGNLNMYSYAPTTLPVNAPLVIVMHGCTQTASQYATESGWNTLANQHQFYTVYPEQVSANNSSLCFNWFNYADQNKGQGEALSIKQMIDYMTSHYSIDASRIYVTGLSAGACMTNVMMACYPEVISKGAVMAGTAFKSATNSTAASFAMGGSISHSALAWGDSVRHQNPSYLGAFPKVAIFHGASDLVVYASNMNETIKQWTNIHNTDQTIDVSTTNFNGNSYVTKYEYNNASNTPVVIAYLITGMGHAISVDPGTCYQQGGAIGTYALDFNFHSSFWAAQFFGILQAPSVVAGNISVSSNSTSSYSVVPQAGNSYTWTVPTGASIVSGQGTNAITVSFSTTSGNVSVTETDVNGCKIGPLQLWVTVGSATNIYSLNDITSEVITYHSVSKSLLIQNTTQEINSVKLYSIDGKLIQQWYQHKKECMLEPAINNGLYLIEYEINHQVKHQKIFIY